MPDLLRKVQRFSLTKTILIFLAVFVGLRILYWHLFLPYQVRASDMTVENIMSAVNRERALRNLLALNPDNRLASAAQSKSDDMQTRHYFSHTDPEGNYIWPKIVAAGYAPYLQLGENLAIEFYSTESLVNAWMNSPTHRANILNEGFKDQGLGLGFGNSDTGQYHSAITNTFGTLSIKKTGSASPLKSAEAGTPASTETQPSPKPATEPKPAPKPEPAPQAPAVKPENQLAVRGSKNSGFALPQSSPSDTTTNNASSAPQQKPVPQEIQNKPSQQKPADITRYLSLLFAFLIVFFIVSDIKDAFKNKLAGLDKKINNLVLLTLALLVLIFLYWL